MSDRAHRCRQTIRSLLRAVREEEVATIARRCLEWTADPDVHWSFSESNGVPDRFTAIWEARCKHARHRGLDVAGDNITFSRLRDHSGSARLRFYSNDDFIILLASVESQILGVVTVDKRGRD